MHQRRNSLVRKNWNLSPQAVLMVRALARQRNIPQGIAASLLILNGGAGRKSFKKRNNILLARNDRIPVTQEDVRTALCDD